MLDLKSDTRVWPDSYRPTGHGTIEPEPFADWWSRHKGDLAHLHPMIAEQWVYRHFDYTSYSCLELSRLSWTEERWPASEIISKALVPGNELDPEFDYETFAGEQTATGSPFLQSGTWDYPALLLRTPNGVRTWQGEFPNARYLLIEGHQRIRMLNAMASLGKPMAPLHSVFVLSQTVGQHPAEQRSEYSASLRKDSSGQKSS